MALTPTAPAMLTASRLKTLLSQLEAFQTWCGVDNAVDAAARITVGIMLGEPAAWPWVQMYVPDDARGEEHIAVGTYTETWVVHLIAANLVGASYQNNGSDAAIFLENEFDTIKGFLRSVRGSTVSGIRLEYTIKDLARPAFIKRSEAIDEEDTTADRYEAYQCALELELGPGAEV